MYIVVVHRSPPLVSTFYVYSTIISRPGTQIETTVYSTNIYLSLQDIGHRLSHPIKFTSLHVSPYSMNVPVWLDKKIQ